MYRIYYNDGTWMDYPEMDDDYVDAIVKGMVDGKKMVFAPGLKLLVRFENIRSIRWIEHITETETQSYSPELSAEEKEYIENYRLAERLHAEMESKKVNASYEDEFGDGDL